MTAVPTETNNSETKVKQPEMTMESLSKITEARHKVLSQLVGVHLDTLLADVLSTRHSYRDRLQAATAVKEALLFVLDFGLDVTKAKIRQGGQPKAKQTNTLAGVLAQALDNRMLMLAQKMESEKQTPTDPVVEQDKVQTEVSGNVNDNTNS